MNEALEKLRQATKDTEYEGKLYLVGGIVRDKLMGLHGEEDIDIVWEGNALDLARFLFNAGIADHAPVVYPRFGTAMISVAGQQVELVSARKESYAPESRKPFVEFATLDDDILRRDFTINTLLENLHSGKILDLTGEGCQDIEKGIIRTPTDPAATFEDDPLRMLRAIRFAARFGFTIEEETFRAIFEEAYRLPIISGERIRDEFSKMLMTRGRSRSLELLRETGLLSQFAPELETMYGVTQNIYHLYDVWTHTLKAVEALPEDSGLILRIATVFHDVGKPATKSVDDQGNVHFYTHQDVGAQITRKVLSRLRYSSEIINTVSKIVKMHLRVGEYDSDWTDAAVRRLIIDAGPELDTLIQLTMADRSAANPEFPSADLDELQRRINEVNEQVHAVSICSPLTGKDIMELLNIPAGPQIGEIKDFLTNEVIEGRLAQSDRKTAKEIVLSRWA